MGQIEKSTYGNGLVRTRSYDNYHFPTQIMFRNGNSIVDQTNYGFNSITGNLSSRNEGTPSVEYFTYDNLNRLTAITGGKTISYLPNGNISVKSDVGTYQYGTNAYQPHAVVGLTNTAPNTPAILDNISNTSYNRVSSITRQGSSITFGYNADKQRNKMEYSSDGVTQETTYYVGNYEKIVEENGNYKEYDYIYTPDGLSAIAIKTNGNNTPEFYYTNTDYLGSIRAITDVDRNLYARFSYDAWGVQSEAPFSMGRITNRGYTGHEHLPEFGLINMNARMYDPVLGRFLEVDPYVADGTFSQDFNRYTYARNNPLIYTDPSGESLALAMKALIFIGNGISNIVNGKPDAWETAWNNSNRLTNEFSNCLQVPVYQNDNTRISVGLDPFALGISANVYYTPNGGTTTFSANAGIGMLGGWNANASASQKIDEVTLGIGYGGGNGHSGWNVNAEYRDFRASYYRTTYRGADAQIVGGVNLGYKDIFSLRVENDAFGDGRDRYRSSALEIDVCGFIIGKHVYTNAPNQKTKDFDKTYESKTYGKTGVGAYKDSEVYRSPAYIGLRHGNTISRIGINNPRVQDITQNGWHLLIGKPLVYTPYGKYSSLYMYSGYYNPYSLYH